MKIFDKISINKPRKSVFDLSHERKFSMNMGDLVPVLCQEVIPGDKFRINMEQLVRFMPMIAPMMHRVNVYTHFFFVPNRLVWNDWEKFITGGDKGIDTPVFPTFSNGVAVNSLKAATEFKYGSLLDYMGFPIKQIQDSTLTTEVPKIEISQLPFRAYQLIYNEYYRDQNLETSIDIPKTSGSNTWQLNSHRPLLQLRKRAWEKDYFTSALPYAQKGAELTFPISGTAEVEFDHSGGSNAPIGVNSDGTGKISLSTPSVSVTGELVADLSGADTSTINELRQAFQIQKWLERNARGGTRYIEQILSHFGVKSSDARLQRPEYLGGGKTPVTVSEVLQMSATDETSPQGTMAGHGVSVGNSNQFSRYFEEHGMIIGIMSVLPRTAYMQGLPRYMTKTDRYDFYWPEFAHLGEQAVKKQELFWNPASQQYNESDFGYQPRYSEYRYIPDTVHGEFANTLKFWHMAREFSQSTPPALNSDFVQCKGDSLTRPFAVQDASQKLLVQTYCNIKAIRPIPKYGNPGGI
ncbi:MAG: major capsid protein [Desulfurococcaceae archaeon]